MLIPTIEAGDCDIVKECLKETINITMWIRGMDLLQLKEMVRAIKDNALTGVMTAFTAPYIELYKPFSELQD
jgi:hypothetical protein